jgi:chromate transporter
MTEPNAAPRAALTELFALFFKLGATAFGGPAAHVAMMQREVVERRRWLDDQQFLDLLSVANLIPGPTSTELAIHIGWMRRKLVGSIVSGAAFIAPAMGLSMACGWAYVSYGSLPQVSALLYGVKPAVLAIVVQAFWTLVPKAASTPRLRLLLVGALLASLFQLGELWILLGTGLLSLSLAEKPLGKRLGVVWLAPVVPAYVAGAAPVTLPSLFWVFLKTGSLLFGSGYVLLAFLRADLVERLGWLSESQLMDAIAVGQITPGPVFTTATFIGYLLSGPSGALVATAGIFLPAFVFVALTAPLVSRLRHSKRASAFLDGVNAASCALILHVSGELARAALIDLPSALVFGASLFLLLRYRPNPTWVVLGGGAIGVGVAAASGVLS